MMTKGGFLRREYRGITAFLSPYSCECASLVGEIISLVSAKS